MRLFVVACKGRLEAYAIVPLFERAQKKILPEGGNARFFASCPLRQDHGSGSGALEGEREPFLFYRCLLLQQQSASHLIGRFRAHQIVHHGHAESIDHAWLFV